MIATRLERLIPDTTGIIAVIIMVCAFMLSFANLQAGAVTALAFKIPLFSSFEADDYAKKVWSDSHPAVPDQHDDDEC